MNLSLFRLARRALGLIWIALFGVLVGFSVLTNVAPLSGHDLFIIIGGSMEPAIPIGSLVLTSPTDAATVVAGDVLTIYRVTRTRAPMAAPCPPARSSGPRTITSRSLATLATSSQQFPAWLPRCRFSARCF